MGSAFSATNRRHHGRRASELYATMRATAAAPYRVPAIAPDILCAAAAGKEARAAVVAFCAVARRGSVDRHSGKNDSDPSLITKAEVLLDRDHFSPGEIDGMNGDNYRRAVLQQANNLPATGILDAATWNALTSNAPGPVLKPYTITDADLDGPFDKEIPVDLKQMAELHGLSYTSPLAELAEKFLMTMEFLRKLNPRADFERPGQEIAVASARSLSRSSAAIPTHHFMAAVMLPLARTARSNSGRS
jgi:hypothetical protein